MFPLPPSARIDTLLLGCTHYPLLRPSSPRSPASGVAIVDSATATASALAELLAINGLEAPDAAAHRPSPRPAHDRRRRRVPAVAPAAVRRCVPGRRSGRARRAVPRERPGRRSRRRPGPDEAAVARRPRLAGRVPRRLGARAPRPRSSAGAPSARRGRASSTGRRPSGSRSAACVGAGQRSRAAELRAAEPEYAAAMARIVPRLSEALGTELPGVVERAASSTGPAGSGPTSRPSRSLIGTLEDELLDQVVPEGGGLGKATMALANRCVTTRQLGFLLGFMGTQVLGQYDLALLSAEATPAGCCSSRRTSGARPGRWASRSGRSGRGSRCTRRPTPSSSRRIPGSGRTSPSGSSASSACSAGRRRSAATRCSGWARSPRRRRRDARSTGSSGS